MISLLDITLEYYSGKKDLDKFSFVMESGLNFLIGAKGAGKSNTVKVLCGIVPILDGNIIIDDEDVSERTSRERNIFLVSSYNLPFPNKTVMQNLLWSSKLRGVGKEHVEAVINEVGLEPQKKCKNLTQDELLNFFKARLLLRPFPPKVIIFDEPYSFLGSGVTQFILESKAKYTLVTLPDGEHLSEFKIGKLSVIRYGKILFSESLEQIDANSLNDYERRLLNI